METQMISYKEGKLQKALEDAFLAIDAKLTTEEVIKELAQVAGRPTEDEDEKGKVADEDDVDNEEAALLHEEATMIIEELLTRYRKNCHKGPPRSKSGAGTGEEPGSQGLNGEAGPEDPSRETPSQENGPMAKVHTGLSSILERGTEAGQSSEPGPSCSSASDKLLRVAKYKFFEDSEDESDEAEEEEEDSEECSEEEGGYSSEEAENEEDEDDTEEAEEDDEEEMMVPGMEGKEEPGSDSGTTAVVALIRGKQLIVANAGDSRCMVSEAGKALDMFYDHKPEDEVELARAKNAGSKVTMDGRVNGGLNLSRAIGDHFYKRNKNLPPKEQMISALPDIKVLTLTDDHEDFIQSKISQHDENGELQLLSSIVEELLDQCLAPDTSGDGTGCDNMTCIIICVKPRNRTPVRERQVEI
ncbi:Protein phosphatase 1G [Heterocephalus glaber]|uniref:protein-serine/threonine phosphatase n=1 Tax=Heterocephalus glaber TaxID=10181 RepID=G5BG43_HETGA|nr:Protein phosphatase 1G [Heterocephalus glaber]